MKNFKQLCSVAAMILLMILGGNFSALSQCSEDLLTSSIRIHAGGTTQGEANLEDGTWFTDNCGYMTFVSHTSHLTTPWGSFPDYGNGQISVQFRKNPFTGEIEHVDEGKIGNKPFTSPCIVEITNTSNGGKRFRICLDDETDLIFTVYDCTDIPCITPLESITGWNAHQMNADNPDEVTIEACVSPTGGLSHTDLLLLGTELMDPCTGEIYNLKVYWNSDNNPVYTWETMVLDENCSDNYIPQAVATVTVVPTTEDKVIHPNYRTYSCGQEPQVCRITCDDGSLENFDSQTAVHLSTNGNIQKWYIYHDFGDGCILEGEYFFVYDCIVLPPCLVFDENNCATVPLVGVTNSAGNPALAGTHHVGEQYLSYFGVTPSVTSGGPYITILTYHTSVGTFKVTLTDGADKVTAPVTGSGNGGAHLTDTLYTCEPMLLVCDITESLAINILTEPTTVDSLGNGFYLATWEYTVGCPTTQVFFCMDPCDDDDGDGVCNEDDICPGGDDNVDTDGDGVPDYCDICEDGDDNLDDDGDGVPNDCDICPGHDDNQDSNGNGVPDGCETDPCDDNVSPVLSDPPSIDDAYSPCQILDNLNVAVTATDADGNIDSLFTSYVFEDPELIMSWYAIDNCGAISSVTETYTLLTPIVTLTSVNPSCSGQDGSIDVNINPPDQGWIIEWSNDMNGTTITGLGGGVYDADIYDQYGCLVESITVVLESPVPGTVTYTVETDCNGLSSVELSLDPSLVQEVIWGNGEIDVLSVDNISEDNITVNVLFNNDCDTTLTVMIDQTDTLSIAVDLTQSHLNTTCFGEDDGLIFIDVTGGSGNYTYEWTNDVSDSALADDLGPGVYTVIVTDGNNCSKSLDIEITEQGTIQATADVTNEDCPNDALGSITLNVADSTATYEYDWSNNSTEKNLSNVSSGIYSVTITRGECSLVLENIEVECFGCKIWYDSDNNTIEIDANFGNDYNGPATINVVDLNGRSVGTYTRQFTDGELEAPDGVIPAPSDKGVYVVTVEVENQIARGFSYKIVVH